MPRISLNVFNFQASAHPTVILGEVFLGCWLLFSSGCTSQTGWHRLQPNGHQLPFNDQDGMWQVCVGPEPGSPKKQPDWSASTLNSAMGGYERSWVFSFNHLNWIIQYNFKNARACASSFLDVLIYYHMLMGKDDNGTKSSGWKLFSFFSRLTNEHTVHCN